MNRVRRWHLLAPLLGTLALAGCQAGADAIVGPSGNLGRGGRQTDVPFAPAANAGQGQPPRVDRVPAPDARGQNVDDARATNISRDTPGKQARGEVVNVPADQPLDRSLPNPASSQVQTPPEPSVPASTRRLTNGTADNGMELKSLEQRLLAKIDGLQKQVEETRAQVRIRNKQEIADLREKESILERMLAEEQPLATKGK